MFLEVELVELVVFESLLQFSDFHFLAASQDFAKVARGVLGFADGHLFAEFLYVDFAIGTNTIKERHLEQFLDGLGRELFIKFGVW